MFSSPIQTTFIVEEDLMKVQTQKASLSATEFRLSRIGIDLAKDSFHMVGFDTQGPRSIVGSSTGNLSRNGLSGWIFPDW